MVKKEWDGFVKYKTFTAAVKFLYKKVTKIMGIDIFEIQEVIDQYKEALKINGYKEEGESDDGFRSKTEIFQGYFSHWWKFNDGRFYRINIQWMEDCWYIDCGFDVIGDGTAYDKEELLKMAVNESNLEGEDPDIYSTIYNYFGVLEDDNEREALYNYIADYNGISIESQCNNQQIDLLYEKQYLKEE